jgi:hypothetical protein
VEHEASQAELLCVVANVAMETAHGEGGLELRQGLRHFTAGAKVWVLPPQWGDGGADVVVVGYHRGTKGRGLVRMVMPRRHLTRFRVQPVYSPAVAREPTRPLTEFGREHAPVMWTDRGAAMQSAERWRDRPLDAWLDGRWHCEVPDPPPLELCRNGQAYYLAHFNAYEAVYSPDPPPPEQGAAAS